MGTAHVYNIQPDVAADSETVTVTYIHLTGTQYYTITLVWDLYKEYTGEQSVITRDITSDRMQA